MTPAAFADELDKAADGIAHISQADLQNLLRRAALHIRTADDIALGSDVDKAITSLSADLNLSRKKALQVIVWDWLIGCGRAPADRLDEESETGGYA